MNAIYIPVAPQPSATSHTKPSAGNNAKNAEEYLATSKEDNIETSMELGIDQSIDENFFDIAFSQITSGKQPTIDVYKQGPIVQGAGQPQVSDLQSFGKAFNFDPVLNLTTQHTGETILSGLDQAGQNELVEQLIGGLPTDVINTGFEQFTVPAGIENYDIPPTILGTDQSVLAADDTAINLFAQPVQPLQPLQGQLPSNANGDTLTRDALGREIGKATENTAPKDQTSPALIATGLTPAQITQLSAAQSEQAVQAESGDVDVDVVMIAVLPIATSTQPIQAGLPQSNTDTLKGIKDKHGSLGQDAPLSSADLKALKDTIDQLAPLNSGNAASGRGAGTQTAGQVDPMPQQNGATVSFEALVEDGFLTPEDLTIFTKENASSSANRDLPFTGEGNNGVRNAHGHNIDKTNGSPAGHSVAETATAKAQTVSNAMGIVPWDSLPEMGALGVPVEGMSLGQILHNTAHTSPTLMHSHAAAPHQATQTIAAKLTQNANKSGEAELTIELDPPELGRVRIQMIAEKDGSVKAQLSFDKPETFLMMQRDSAQLEKSLAEAGIDMGENTLEFSLSSDNNGDNAGDSNEQDTQHGSSGAENGDDATNSQDVEIVTTKMDWYHDNNGALRLDMMA